MPIYEYECGDCQDRVEIFFRSFADLETKEAVCPHCRGGSLQRLISNVAVVGPAQSETASRASTNTTGDQDDPKSLAKTMRRAGQTAGQDIGRDFNEVAGRLERGESATSIEKSLRKRVGEPMQPH